MDILFASPSKLARQDATIEEGAKVAKTGETISFRASFVFTRVYLASIYRTFYLRPSSSSIVVFPLYLSPPRTAHPGSLAVLFLSLTAVSATNEE